MTLADVLRIRSAAVVRDGGEVEEPYFGGWLRYGFEQGPEGSRHRRLTHVERTEPFLDKASARARWYELATRLAAEVDTAIRCTDRSHGEVHWRRARIGAPGAPVSFVVDLQQFGETSRSRDPAILVTRAGHWGFVASPFAAEDGPGDSILAGNPISCEAEWKADG